MFVILDENNYVKFLSTTTEMEGSIELPDDDSLNLTYLTCYKLNPEGNGLMLDAEKVSAQKDKLGALSKIVELKQQLSESDFKVLRKLREDTLGIQSKLSDEEYLQMEAERESITRQIRELEDGRKLVTDISEILQEGKSKREEKEQQINEIKNIISTIVPEMKKSIDNLVYSINNGDLVQKLIEEIKKSLISIGDVSQEGSQSSDSSDSSDNNEENEKEENSSNILNGFLGLLDKINNEFLNKKDDASSEENSEESSTSTNSQTENK